MITILPCVHSDNLGEDFPVCGISGTLPTLRRIVVHSIKNLVDGVGTLSLLVSNGGGPTGHVKFVLETGLGLGPGIVHGISSIHRAESGSVLELLALESMRKINRILAGKKEFFELDGLAVLILVAELRGSHQIGGLGHHDDCGVPVIHNPC